MKHDLFRLSSAVVLTLVASSLAAWADTNPDFDDDAKPILRMQPNLLQYVEASFDVKDTGTAKYPGDDDHAARPPYIFRARPLGSSGPYNLRLLIQPGPPGHILGVVDINKVHLGAPASPSSQPPPSVAHQPAPQAPSQPQPAPVTQHPVAAQAPKATTPAPVSKSVEPTADTPSGPILESGSVAPSTAPSLEPPPDPPPATH